jgi:hypothetical protein
MDQGAWLEVARINLGLGGGDAFGGGIYQGSGSLRVAGTFFSGNIALCGPGANRSGWPVEYQCRRTPLPESCMIASPRGFDWAMARNSRNLFTCCGTSYAIEAIETCFWP